MSFKREGDDKNLLGNLRQRRVKELLGEDIPDDEALLLRNGMYSCLVCKHRPILHSVSGLYLHRQGKKHVENAEIFLQEKKELREEILKRKHDKFMSEGHTNIQQATIKHRGLGCGPAYDPRVKKRKTVSNRKLAVDLHNGQEKPDSDRGVSEPSVSNDAVAFRLSAKHSHQEILDGKSVKNGMKNNKMFRDLILEQQREGPVKHSAQLKNIFLTENKQQPCSVEPYRSRMRNYNGDSTRHSNISQTLSSNIEPDPTGIHHEVKGQGHTVTSDISYADLAKTPPPPPEVPQKSMPITAQEKLLIEERKEKAEKYLYFRGAGWKKDLYGNWVKDEDAEFDSDEEPPDLP